MIFSVTLAFVFLVSSVSVDIIDDGILKIDSNNNSGNDSSGGVNQGGFGNGSPDPKDPNVLAKIDNSEKNDDTKDYPNEETNHTNDHSQPEEASTPNNWDDFFNFPDDESTSNHSKPAEASTPPVQSENKAVEVEKVDKAKTASAELDPKDPNVLAKIDNSEKDNDTKDYPSSGGTPQVREKVSAKSAEVQITNQTSDHSHTEKAAALSAQLENKTVEVDKVDKANVAKAARPPVQLENKTVEVAKAEADKLKAEGNEAKVKVDAANYKADKTSNDEFKAADLSSKEIRKKNVSFTLKLKNAKKKAEAAKNEVEKAKANGESKELEAKVKNAEAAEAKVNTIAAEASAFKAKTLDDLAKNRAVREKAYEKVKVALEAKEKEIKAEKVKAKAAKAKADKDKAAAKAKADKDKAAAETKADKIKAAAETNADKIKAAGETNAEKAKAPGANNPKESRIITVEEFKSILKRPAESNSEGRPSKILKGDKK